MGSRHLWCGVIALLASCIDSGLVLCGDQTCPVGDVCTVGGCASSASATACAALDDGSPCTAATIAGTCMGGFCHPAECGNHILDQGEACDDGNRVSGDGCAADCQSDETCGNGFVDVSKGEQCDTGSGGQSGDGCSSTCALEPDGWEPLSPRPLLRTAHAMAYDAARHRVVMFGGVDDLSRELADTWEWDGGRWIARDPPSAPSARSHHSMAYDASRHRVVLFGGDDFAGDTWEYDGTTWIQRTPAVAPPARDRASMTYDPVNDQIVLFGGEAADGHALGDTWVWDGVTWTVRNVAGPAARIGGAMAFDDVHQRVVLAYDASGVDPNTRDTWAWDGSTWTMLDATGYSQGHDPVMAFDEVTAQLVMIVNSQGGEVSVLQWGTASGSGAQVWNFVSGASGAWSEQLAFDGTQLLRFGGVATAYVTDQTWVGHATDTGQWLEVSLPALAPSARSEAAMIYNDRTGRIVLVGGAAILACCGTFATDDVWEWDGVAWTTDGPSPPGFQTAMTYDTSRDVTVLYGGSVNATTTWEAHGATWAVVMPTGSPGARVGHAMAYDSARKTSVLFGGVSSAGGTWEWNGASWTETNTAADSPPERSGARMAYDAQRKKVVMFGGLGTDNLPRDDTWEWDGTWHAVASTVAPSARTEPVLTYDRRRQRVVLFGGHSRVRAESDLWEWDGVTWAPRTPSAAPPPRSGAAGVYDPIHGELIVVGGTLGAGSSLDDLWAARFASVTSPADRCVEVDTDGDGLAGCADPDCSARCAYCGDGTCDPVESYLICPGDCPP